MFGGSLQTLGIIQMSVFRLNDSKAMSKEQGQEQLIRDRMEYGMGSGRRGPKMNENLAFIGLWQKSCLQLSTNSPSRQGYRKTLGAIERFFFFFVV